MCEQAILNSGSRQDASRRRGWRLDDTAHTRGLVCEPPVIGQQQVAPSRVFNPAGLDYPKAMTVAEIRELIADFGRAAKLAVRQCGFDAIEVHAGHGYLLSQFLSPLTNTRTDEYGCKSHSSRCRFVLEADGARGYRRGCADHHQDECK